jgi:NAD(P)-dependent dehydrogenase (short-subunit alcohol dehydrogenase family)
VADLAQPLGAARLYAAACERLGGRTPDALVNNAALFTGDDDVLACVNFDAPKKLTTLMACREEGCGSVVNILDCRVLTEPDALDAAASDAYTRSKRDLHAWTRTAAALFALTLRVNGVAPGPVMVPVRVHEKAGPTPLGRPTPQAVAEAVAFLLQADATSGCVIPVDGGQFLA